MYPYVFHAEFTLRIDEREKFFPTYAVSWYFYLYKQDIVDFI
jgi:hypothetical protein